MADLFDSKSGLAPVPEPEAPDTSEGAGDEASPELDIPDVKLELDPDFDDEGETVVVEAAGETIEFTKGKTVTVSAEFAENVVFSPAVRVVED